MNKVLILCDEFPPLSGPRMGYLVKYLSRLGWESYVITGEVPAQNPRRPFRDMSMGEKVVALRSMLGFLGARRSMSVLRAADALVSVSPWHVRWLKERCNENSFLVYNGYDPEAFFPVTPRPSDCFKIVYTGTLASESSRDYTFLLESVQSLHGRGVIDPRTFQVVFYSGEVEKGNPIHERIASKGIGDFFSFRDFVPSSEVPSILGDASVLLVLTSRNGFHGVMTTKFFEYLAVNRPILCVASDEGVLEEAMREAECGCAARSADEAEQFIERLYREWQTNGATAGTTRSDRIGSFSRKFQAGQFVEIFRQVIANRREAHS